MTLPLQAHPSFRIAVIDVGSNSLRLVVFERIGGVFLALLNEKVMCGLGRGIAESGRLNPDGVTLALPSVQRFVTLANAVGVDHLAIVATAAVREATDGRAFAAEVERRCGVPVTIVDGPEEARLSASGVLAGIPDAEGIVADLGGGSVELIEIKGHALGGELSTRAALPDEIGGGVTLPLGPLRLSEHGESEKRLAEIVERQISRAAVLRSARDRTLYLVGGAWRAIARLHMDQVRYPLHVIHGYTLSRSEAETYLDGLARASRKSLDKVAAVSRKRLDVLPVAALVLRKLIAAAQPDRLVFSAFGLREGYAYGVIPPAERASDPLIAACAALAQSQSRFALEGEGLARWIAPLFPSLPPALTRLHRAAAWLSDIAWSEHPDYRAEQAFTRSLRIPFAAMSHADRLFLATGLHARYGGAIDDPIRAPTRRLLDPGMESSARALGLALRLAYTLCGGATQLLETASLSRSKDAISLELSAAGSAGEDRLFVGEAVQRRLEALARALGLGAVVRRADLQRVADDRRSRSA